MREKSKKKMTTEKANESTFDQTSQLSFSSVNKVKTESNEKIEIDKTYDCDNKTMMFVAQENGPLHSEVTIVDEVKNEILITIKETEGYLYETTTKIKKEYDTLNMELTNVEEKYNKPKLKVEIDILNGCCFKTVVEIERNRLYDSYTKRPFVCNECPKTFTSKRCMDSHITKSHNENTATRKSYQIKLESNIHSVNKINNEAKETDGKNQLAGEQSYTCEACLKSFAIKSNLTRHKLSHTGEKPYECVICSKPFKMKSYLTRHNKRSHSGEKPYKCDFKSDLTQHKLVHTGEKTYTCDVCLKPFSAKSNLAQHKRVHTNEKPYTCVKCLKSFSSKYSLVTHERMHTEGHRRFYNREKPYECDICLKHFSTSYDLIQHKFFHS